MSKSFGELFTSFRTQSGFETVSQFGQALAEEGFIYEDSIFSKWKSGERLPRERKLVLAIIAVFSKRNKGFSLEDANLILDVLDMRRLNPLEIEVVFAHTTWSLDHDDYYGEYRAIEEPNVLFQNLQVTELNLRAYILEEIEDLERRDYWQYQVRCAIAGYYSKLSDGKKTAADVFRTLAWDYFDQNAQTYTVILTVMDEVSGEEYIALTLRCVRGSSNTGRVLEVYDLFDVQPSWPHEERRISKQNIGELSRFVIPNWAWNYNTMIVKLGFWTIVRYARSRGIEFFYAIVSDYITQVLKDAGIAIVYVEGVTPYYTYKNAKELYPIAFEDAHDYALFWQRFRPRLCYFEINI